MDAADATESSLTSNSSPRRVMLTLLTLAYALNFVEASSFSPIGLGYSA